MTTNSPPICVCGHWITDHTYYVIVENSLPLSNCEYCQCGKYEKKKEYIINTGAPK